MKKNRKKLTLNRETLQNLATVVGADRPTLSDCYGTCDTCGTCRYTCYEGCTPVSA